jgi:isoquinoline 1-oxidoreductase beta subunit
MTLCGGGFGRRGETSFVRQAAVMAAETGGAVKVIWAREEDIQHDAYRPAMAYRFRALVGSSGDLEALEERIAGPGVWANTRPELVRGRLDPLAVEGLTDRTYAIPNHVVEYVMTEAHLPIGYWRSVGYSHNVFFRESAIDEAAYANDQDPTSSDAPC